MISYYGGKARMAKTIVGMMTPHDRYVEPFAGGLSVFFSKPRVEIEVVNDHDERLVRIYRLLQENATARELIARLVLTPHSRTVHQRTRDTVITEEVVQAWADMIDVGQGFGSQFCATFNPTSINRNHAHSWIAQLDKLIQGHFRLLGCTIEKMDSIKCIERYDTPTTFFYCDPPYPGANQCHYKGYTHDDLAALFDALTKAKGSSIVSCYDCGVRPPPRWLDIARSVRIHRPAKRVERSGDRKD